MNTQASEQWLNIENAVGLMIGVQNAAEQTRTDWAPCTVETSKTVCEVLESAERKIHQRPKVQHLSESQWAALEKAERPYYTNGGGGHAYTDVLCRQDDDGWIYSIWWQCQAGVESDGDIGLPDRALEARVAKRVAQALAVMSFGPEFLIR